MKYPPTPRSDAQLRAGFACDGELGQSYVAAPRVMLAEHAHFEMPNSDHGTRVLGFVRADVRSGALVERRLRLAKVSIVDGDITAHVLAGSLYQVGDVAAVRTGDEIQFSRIADPIWEGLERRSFPLAPGQPFVEGAYSLSVDATRAADTARIGEEEHEDDYEHAFLQTYAIVEAVVNRQAQRTCSFTASDSMLRFEPHTLDVQEAAHKRMLVQNVIGDLRRERPELVPPEIGAIADLADLVGTLEAHWARCLGALRGLSLLRDYNRSHRATAHVVVAALPRLAAAAGAVSSSTTGWHGSSTAAGVSPFHTRGGNSATAAPDTGSLLLQVLGPRMLLGHSERLIRFDSPYYQRSYAMDLTKTTPGVSTFSW